MDVLVFLSIVWWGFVAFTIAFGSAPRDDDDDDD